MGESLENLFLSDNDVDMNRTLKVLEEENPGGLKHSLHGNIFQVCTKTIIK